jgi:hypothetical protein
MDLEWLNLSQFYKEIIKAGCIIVQWGKSIVLLLSVDLKSGGRWA